MKLLIYIGIFIGSTIGGWLGAMMDHGNWFGAWSIIIGGLGAFVGLWAGYKASQNFY